MSSKLKVASVVLVLLTLVRLSTRVPRASAIAQVTGRTAEQTTPSPTFADVDYAPPDPATSVGHKLDLYVPAAGRSPLPVVLWTAGSAWRADTGKRRAEIIAAQLNPRGFAVVGVSIRSSSQAKFPAQLHDIKAAIRWLRANAAKYNLDPNRVGIMGDSSGGWTAAMAAVTGNSPDMEGTVGTLGPTSAVQAAIAFYPPTDFLSMDQWALRKCTPSRGAPLTLKTGFCHDDENSPESQLVGCAIQTCPEKVAGRCDVRRRIRGVMIFHGNSDPAVPHNQCERFYMALNKACADAVFISLPKAGHGPLTGFLTDDAVREGATMRSTTAAGCTVTNPIPYVPTWQTVIAFLEKHLHR